MRAAADDALAKLGGKQLKDFPGHAVRNPSPVALRGCLLFISYIFLIVIHS
jgi:hypothetical protein